MKLRVEFQRETVDGFSCYQFRYSDYQITGSHNLPVLHTVSASRISLDAAASKAGQLCERRFSYAGVRFLRFDFLTRPTIKQPCGVGEFTIDLPSSSLKGA